MAFRKNDGLRNAQADAFGDLFNSGKLQIRTGGQPADPDSAATGTLLAEINLPANAFTPAASAAISNNGIWGATAVATATAGWGRFISADTLKTFDVTVAEVGADLTITEQDIVTGDAVRVTSFTFTVPAS